ncbi:hypothetical protein KR054_011122 [Drosophila jambulina]|nr:hypothetical protein KR054_011122 [Drosophila jambulina]
MSGATKENVQLLAAVVKHPALYDRNDENYRKRLPSENSWDMVASEVGGSVEKCKRRWRQLRNDYTRWLNADANRRRHGQRRLAYPLQEEFRFLDRHLNLADATNDEEPSGSEKDRDSNRDSESRDNTSASLKGDAAPDDKSVNDESSVAQLLGEEDKDTTKEKPKPKKVSQEKSVEKELQEPERTLEEDSYLQSDQEGDEPIEEEHLEQLEEDFEFEEEGEEELVQDKEKGSSLVNTEDSPASQSEFFIKQNKEPHLMIIGKKNATLSGSEAPDAEAEDSNLDDPLDDEIAMQASLDEAKIARRRDSVQSPSRRLRRVKDVPIKKPTQAPRVTRHQRRKSMSLAAGQSIRSSTSPVKMTPVPRTVGASKSVQVKKSVPLKDGYFSRPATPATDGRQGPRQSLTQSQPQRPPLMRRLTTSGSRSETPTPPPKRGRPPKKYVVPQRFGSPQVRQPSPSTPKVIPIPKASTAVMNAGTNIANKVLPTTNPAGNLAKRVTATTLKPMENVTVMSYSPLASSNPSSAGSIGKPISKSSPLGVASTSTSTAAAVSANAVPFNPNPSLLRRCERTTQTECQDIFSDEHFLEMIRPQMKEMNARQKMHFKKKVFQALMETFDDATDFPEAGELQHFNINTPSGFEHVTTAELRLVRELVSMVSAAKVSARGQPQPQPQTKPPGQSQPKDGGCYTAVNVSESQRGNQTLSIPSHLIQRLYKSGSGTDATAKNAAAPGGEKKMYRLLKTPNGKPNGISSSMEDLRKDSVDSEQSAVSSANIPPASPKGAAVVAPVRPQGSSINSLFGPSSNVQAVRPGPSLKARAMARRYSTCNNQASLPNSQSLGYPSSLHSNLTPMEANALKRRLMAPAQPMVLPTQRPRYSVGPGVQQIVTPQGNSLLLRKPIGASPGNQKQQVSPSGGVVLTPQKTPQITNVQGAAFKDFAQPKPTAAAVAASPASSASSASPAAAEGGTGTPQSVALKRSLVVANAKGKLQPESPVNKPQQQQQSPQAQKTNPRYASMTAATIAADDFSLASLKREPVDHMDDQDDILGM